MNKLLIATHNPAKKQELREGFLSTLRNNDRYSLLTLDDLHITADPEETGSTFLENARLKAHFFGNLSGIPTIADDGGIEIDCLNGEPGVHSKRWLGRNATDDEMIEYTLKKLEGIPLEKRSAHFTVCLFYYHPVTKREISIIESVEGMIALTPSKRARKGFPYRALFIVNTYNKYYDELTDEEHKDINHRLAAIRKLVQKI